MRGRFTAMAGEVTFGERLADSSVVVDIQMASVSSGDRSRDDHLRSADLFDVDLHPMARFRSTGLEVADASATMHGKLTIKGITRPVTLDVDDLGHARDPWANDRAVFSAHGTINREDWGLTWNMLLEAGGLLVSKEIKLRDRRRARAGLSDRAGRVQRAYSRLASSSISSRKSGWVTSSSARTRSRIVLPRSSAMPCSVTT